MIEHRHDREKQAHSFCKRFDDGERQALDDSRREFDDDDRKGDVGNLLPRTPIGTKQPLSLSSSKDSCGQAVEAKASPSNARFPCWRD